MGSLGAGVYAITKKNPSPPPSNQDRSVDKPSSRNNDEIKGPALPVHSLDEAQPKPNQSVDVEALSTSQPIPENGNA